MRSRAYDCAVVGAGVFGSWIAWHLARAGKSVALVDAYGPGNSLSSSGGETRLIRMGYGEAEVYTHWSWESLRMWKQLSRATGRPLFRQTGVLWLAADDDAHARASLKVLRKAKIPVRKLTRRKLSAEFPQIANQDVEWALFEPASGVLMARQSVQTVAADAAKNGVKLIAGSVLQPRGSGDLPVVTTAGGEEIRAHNFVFACGPWLGKVFPELLGNRIFPSRQEVFFFAPPSGSAAFNPPELPAWLVLRDAMYGVPNIDFRGVKISCDRHGPRFDPDTGTRVPNPEMLALVREYLGRRLPAMKNATLVEARVCQYENTSNGDLLLDRHPDFDNVWIAGGGSGHGFKHGPMVGKHLAGLITGRTASEPKFSLATKATIQQRAVY